MLRAIRFLCPCCNIYDDDPRLMVQKEYEIGEVIGQGMMGVVHKCIHRTTREEFACKKMPITKNAYNEIGMLKNHLFGGDTGILSIKAYYCPERDRLSKNIYIISEFCDGGDLQHLLAEHGHGILSQRQTARIIQSLVQSLKFCHSRKIIHRDVKPSSVFIANTVNSSSWACKLGNFDVAIWKGNRTRVMDNVGTLGYSAPEMLCGNGYSYEVDIWSAGAVLYVLLCGKKPFDAENEDAKSMYEKMQNTEPDLTSGAWSSISDSVKELVVGMLQKDPKRRFSCNQVLSHPWILSAAEMDMSYSSELNTENASNPRVAAGQWPQMKRSMAGEYRAERKAIGYDCMQETIGTAQ